jgi:uncharacterized protein (DUF934 family)
MDFIPLHDPIWQRLDGEDGPRPHALLSLEQWHAVRDSWPAGLPAGVVLPNTADVATVAAELPRWSLVALQFPKWTDGSAYSQARLLRGRHGYTGELRAVGDVLADMLPLLQRTGFSSVQLRADQSITSARRALHFFAGHYQGDVTQPQPLFKRQAA